MPMPNATLLVFKRLPAPRPLPCLLQTVSPDVRHDDIIALFYVFHSFRDP